MPNFMGPHNSHRTEIDVAIPMRDGRRLFADIYRPDTTEPVPVLLQRTPYNKATAASRTGGLDLVRAVSHGYAVVIQDARGRYTSEGQFDPFRNEMEDGYDTVEWCASQPWSTGKTGMYGGSYLGATQWLAAMSRTPSLTAIVPRIIGSDFYEGVFYQGGAFQLGLAVSWGMAILALANFERISHYIDVPADTPARLIAAIDGMDETFRSLPLSDFPHLKDGLAPYFYDWLAHPRMNEYWKPLSIEDHYAEMTVPALHVGGWHDSFLGGTLKNFQGMREKGPTEAVRKGQKLLIGPWHHGPGSEISGEFYFGIMANDAAIDLQGTHLRWYDYWLKGIDNGITDDPPVRIFVMGDNVWRSEQEWPLARTQYVDYYLHSQGKANTLNGDGGLSPEAPGAEPPDLFLYDPRSPVPTKGGATCCSAAFLAGGPFDQRAIEARQDVLVYTSPVLDQDLEVTGPVTVTLYTASSCPDTDFTAKLVDVCPCDCTRSLTDGIIRARYRESTSAPKLLEPGQVYKYDIDLMATSNVFKAGHRIRVEVSSSNFPRFDRNPNTGREPSEETELRPAVQTVCHSEQYPSRITLPVIPKG